MDKPGDGSKKGRLGAFETQVLDVQDVVLSDLPPSDPEMPKVAPPPLPPVPVVEAPSPSVAPPPPAPGRSPLFYVLVLLGVGVVGGGIGLGIAMATRGGASSTPAASVNGAAPAAEPAVITIPAVEIGEDTDGGP